MARFGFVGPAYQSQSLNADAQLLQNWYVEADESGSGVSPMVLYPTPGLNAFTVLADTPCRALFTFNGRCFAVAGAAFFELLANGTSENRGAVANDGLMATIAANATQLLIVSGGSAYYFVLATNAFAQLDTTSGHLIQGAPLMCGGTDGYLVVLLKDSSRIQISALEDATVWSTLGVPNVDQVSQYPDRVLSMLVDHRQLWLLGEKATLPYYDSGSANIFDPVLGGYIEQGIIAPFSAAKMNNSVFWLGGSDRGNGIAWNAQGYQPVRISNHAVETEWAGYATMADAIGYTYEDQGHTFWVLYFPSAGKTWVFDAATNMWHQRSSWNDAQGVAGPHKSNCHTFAFGKHLVGDPFSGTVNQMAIPSRDAAQNWQFATENGTLIRRIRRAPHVTTEKQWAFHQQLQVNVETGVGPQPPLLDGNDNPRDPMLALRWSDDGGHTWSQPRSVGFGQAGKTFTRSMWRRLGRSRDRVYELSCAEPVPCRVIDAYLIATPGFGVQESLSAQYRKMT